MFILLTSLTPTAYAGLQWQSLDSLKTYNLRDITTNNQGLYVVVGDDGLIRTSTDLKDWNVQDSGTKNYLFGCTWGNGKFVAVGNHGTIVYSEDGTKWSNSIVDSSIGFSGVTWGNGKFMAVGEKYAGKDTIRYILSSTDGINWSKVLEWKGFSNWWGIKYINNQYIAYGLCDDLAISPDGVAWKVYKPYNVEINDIIWDGNQYVGVGSNSSIWTSVNALDWTLSESNLKKGLFLNDLIKFHNKYIMTITLDKANYVVSSTDLKEWEFASQRGFDEITSLIINKDKLIAVGWHETVLQTKDGKEWEVSEKYSPNLLKVIWNSTKFLVMGNNGTVCLSSDGLSWESIKTGIKQSLVDVVWTGKEFFSLAVAFNDTPKSYDINKADVYRSVDGTQWTYHGTVDQSDIQRLFYVNNRFFAIGRKGQILVSTDAKNWTRGNSGTDNWLRGLAWNGKQYVSVGMFGTILTSPDGISWTKQKLNTDNDFNSVLWNGKIFIVIGDWNTIIKSNDGIHWTSKPFSKDYTMIDALWDGERFVVLQNLGEVLLTNDSVKIIKASTDSISSPYSIAWNGERYVMVGRSGTMATSIPMDIVKVKVKDIPIIFDVAPKIINGRTMIPARAVLEKLGATLSWDAKTETIKVAKDGVDISLTIGKQIAIVNGKQVKLDSPATVIDGRTLLPVRFVAESLGANVIWDQNTQTVLIN